MPRWTPHLLALPVALFLLFALGWPLVRVLHLGTGYGLQTALQDPYYWGRLVWSLEYGLGSSLLVLLLAVPLAYAFRYAFPGRDLLLAFATVPFVLPTIVVAMGFLALVGPRGVLGVDLSGTPWALYWGAVFYNLGLVLRMLVGVLARVGEGLEAAARVLGAGAVRAFLRASLPLLAGAMLAGGGLTFVYTFASFGLPLLLGGPRYATLEVEIYTLLAYQLAFSEAAALILLQLAVTALVSLGYLWAQERLAVDFRAVRAARPLSGWKRWGVASVVWVFFLALYAPMLALLAKSFVEPEGLGFGNYLRLLEPKAGLFVPSLGLALGNTLRWAALALLVVLPVGFLYAYAVWKGARWLDLVGFVPLLVSPVSLGVGYLLAYPELRGSVALLVTAYALLAYPLLARALLPAMRGIPPGLLEAAATLGARPWRRFLRVELPLLRPALASGTALALAAVVGEFGATLVLTRPEWATMVVAIYERLGKPGAANFGEALALAVLLALLSAGLFLLVDRGRGRVG
ncbi:ABC transporter permease [Marinithermus hydrothermalis]|uniref:ABC-type transporter, integral membrane subunit n=1 Tax=Marinithermus hydrothermalis (strain DSM 14884 / JCM 11576 / T1) TaxID=869210 RepID=F2NNE3_MARHT|nr:iron ABC transporter permease [Marinithermus hydrothermalis]AEB10984.1 ABC-type transporter, integral membrane subunit [Marinithermus hydrothermalis DSM 14884]